MVAEPEPAGACASGGHGASRGWRGRRGDSCRQRDGRTDAAVDDALRAASREQLRAIDHGLPRWNRAEISDLLARIGRRRVGVIRWRRLRRARGGARGTCTGARRGASAGARRLGDVHHGSRCSRIGRSAPTSTRPPSCLPPWHAPAAAITATAAAAAAKAMGPHATILARGERAPRSARAAA